MEGFPEAVVIASLDSVCSNNNVLFRLVKPLADGSGVESTDRMVNVVPHRRIYCFEKKEEIDEFRHEILKRPLVLQPVLHFGRGLGHYCGMCYDDEPWVVLINQTHPKVLARLQMGLDSAKAAIAKGQSCEVTFSFSNLIQRVYREHLAQKELEEAMDSGSALDQCLLSFRYAEWEHGDLVIRCHGVLSRLRHPSAAFISQNVEANWDFSDIGMHEMIWNQFCGQEFSKPHLTPVYEDEIREVLPGWTINGVSPLEEIGESVPEQNYSYAQAGRLYDSFRKKRRQRNRPQPDSSSEPKSVDLNGGKAPDDSAHDYPAEGAAGCDPDALPRYGDLDLDQIAVEHDFSRHEPVRPARSRRIYYNAESPHDDGYGDYDGGRFYDSDDAQVKYNTNSQSRYGYEPGASSQGPSSKEIHQQYGQKSAVRASQPDSHGHIHANVEVRSTTKPPPKQEGKTPGFKGFRQNEDHNNYDSLYLPGSDNNQNATVLQKQDSDRSSQSTNADSGYCPENDGLRSRGSSYDYNDQSYGPKNRMERRSPGTYPLKDTNEVLDGLENPVFRHDDPEVDLAMQKHKELIANMFRDQNQDTGYNNTRSPTDLLSLKGALPDVPRAPPRQSKVQRGSTSSAPVAESFI